MAQEPGPGALAVFLVAPRAVRRFAAALNVRGIVTVVAVLAAVDLAVAYAAAPWVTRFTQEQINRFSRTKVVVERVRLHPVLLSIDVDGFEVHDGKTRTRQFRAERASMSLDAWAALSGRAGLSRLELDGARLEAVPDASGRYDVRQPTASEMAKGTIDFLKREVTGQRVDFFRSSYDKLKDFLELNRKRRSADRSVKVQERPMNRGRLVDFTSDADPVFTIGRLSLRNATLVVKASEGAVPAIRDLRCQLDGFRLLRGGGQGFSRLELEGRLDSEKPGRFSLSARTEGAAADVDARIEGLDLAAFGPLFADSLPVAFTAGTARLELRARLDEQSLSAKGRFRLDGHRLVARKRLGFLDAVGEPVIAAINRRQTFEMPFEIGGTPDRPAMAGFKDALFKLLADDLKGALAEGGAQGLQEKGRALADKFKSIF